MSLCSRLSVICLSVIGQVSECVVTVPPYLTEHERRIIIDSAAMVDLSVIMLVNDNTAVAIRSCLPLLIFLASYHP